MWSYRTQPLPLPDALTWLASQGLAQTDMNISMAEALRNILSQTVVELELTVHFKKSKKSHSLTSYFIYYKGVPGLVQGILSQFSAFSQDRGRIRLMVDIVIPSYNRKRLLQQAIRSVQKQTFRHFCLYVVDDGSTDGTAGFLRRSFQNRAFKKSAFKLRVLNRRFGVSRARNEGIRQGRRPWIAFFGLR